MLDSSSFCHGFSVWLFLIHISLDDSVSVTIPWESTLSSSSQAQLPEKPEQIQLSRCYQLSFPPPMHLSSLHSLLFPLFLPQTQTTVMFVAPRGSNLQHPPRPFASGLCRLRNDAVRLHLCLVVPQNVEIYS